MKKIPKSDISIRPFKVYKSYTATNADSGSGYNRYLAENKYATADALSEGDLFLHSLWHQVHRM